MIRVVCPTCNAVVSRADDFAGRMTQCQCGQTILMPESADDPVSAQIPDSASSGITADKPPILRRPAAGADKPYSPAPGRKKNRRRRSILIGVLIAGGTLAAVGVAAAVAIIAIAVLAFRGGNDDLPVHPRPIAHLNQQMPDTDGVEWEPEVDCAVEPARALMMGPTFDIAKSWLLSLEVFVVDREDQERLIMFWGDDRPGRDALFLRQKGNTVEASVGDTLANKQHSLFAAFPADLVGKWVRVSFSYDAESNELELSLDDKRVGKEKCAFVPRLDRPMPVWLGGGNAVFQRFNGKARSVRLANR
jgi:hypothetical protein